MKKQILIGAILGITCLSSSAQKLPPPSEFYYCAEFNRWADERLKGEDSKVAKETRTWSWLLDQIAADLTGGSLDLDAYRPESKRLNADLEEHDKKNELLEYVRNTSSQCASLVNENRDAIEAMRKANYEKRKVYSEHPFPGGPLSVETIEQREVQLSLLKNTERIEGRELTWYVFGRRVGRTVHLYLHGFARKGHPAYPALVFMTTTKKAGEALPMISHVGNYAGSKGEFEIVYASAISEQILQGMSQ